MTDHTTGSPMVAVICRSTNNILGEWHTRQPAEDFYAELVKADPKAVEHVEIVEASTHLITAELRGRWLAVLIAEMFGVSAIPVKTRLRSSSGG